MNDPGIWFDREMEEIDRLEADGQIDSESAARQRRELGRAYREEAQESCEMAYGRELDRW